MLPLFSRYLPHILLAGVIFAAAAWWSHSRYQTGYDAARADMAAEVRRAEEATRTSEIESRKRVEAVDREYQSKLQTLDAKYRDAVRRIGAVRVCPDPRSVPVPGDSPATSGSHDTPGGDGLSRPTGAPDIGPGLVELARLADEQTQRLIACQRYVAAAYESASKRREP